MPRDARPTGASFALVVDDSITVRRVTQRLLERNGMRVLTAKDGVDAMAMLQEHVPDMILLDIEMPRMDGYEVASQVRADARLADVPIIMITSRVGEKHRARAIELGVNDYLGKPYQEASCSRRSSRWSRGGEAHAGGELMARHRRTLQPAGAAARRAADRAARLRRRGHGLPAAVGDAGRAALVPRHVQPGAAAACR